VVLSAGRRGGHLMKTRIALTTSLGFIVLLAGCGANGPPPNDQWAAAQTAIGRAQAGGASDVPDARLQLQLAVEDLQRAKQLMGVDNERSTTLCLVSGSEAQLALSLAKKAKADDQAKAAEEELRKAGNP
jgi:hypothetical protein